MDDTKRIMRAAQEIPANEFTEWERGVIFGASAGIGFNDVVARITRKLDEFYARIG
jgi:hypothetical protein